MPVTCESGCNIKNGRGLIARNDFLVLAGVTAIIAGLVLPLSGCVLDVLVIFSLCLTVAILVITFSAKTALEVLGFPLLVVLATILRLALSVTSSKLMLFQDNIGTVIGFFGSTAAGRHWPLAALCLGILALVIIGVIYEAVKKIGSISTELVESIVPVFATLRRGKEATREGAFFVSIAGASRFMLCAALVELAIIIVNIIISTVLELIDIRTDALPVGTHITLTVGAGIVTLIPALLTALATKHLVRKSASISAIHDAITNKSETERIEVVATEVAAPPARGNERARPTKGFNNKTEIKDTGWSEDFRANPAEQEMNDLRLWGREDVKDSHSYESIADLVEDKSGGETRTILMAADEAAKLPVTVPVNIAMWLAKKGRRCLLVDMDLERNAISKVFDIQKKSFNDVGEEKAAATSPIETCIENLWVWPVSKLRGGLCTSESDVPQILAKLKNDYDYLVLYAPDIKIPVDWARVASCVDTAMLFGGTSEMECAFGHSLIADFHSLLTDCGCSILKPDDIFAIPG